MKYLILLDEVHYHSLKNVKAEQAVGFIPSNQNLKSNINLSGACLERVNRDVSMTRKINLERE